MKSNLRKLPCTTLLVVGFLCAVSCIELRDQVGNKIITDENFQTEEEFNIALIPAYAQLNSLLWDWFIASEVSTDELAVPARGFDWYDGGLYHRYFRHEWTPLENEFDQVWMTNFTGIARANRVLREIETFPGSFDTKAEVTAELRCLRAWYYFLLMDFFGGVPVIAGVEFDPDNPPARDSRTFVFQHVESELLAAIPDLPEAYDYGRFSKGAARALLAKLYLNAAVYTGAPRWQDCADQCEAVVNSGQHSLASDFFDNFQPDNHSTGLAEIMLPAVVDAQFFSNMNFHMRTLHYSQYEQFNMTAQPWNGYCTMADFYNSFDHNTDQRSQAFLEGLQFHPVTGDPIVDPSNGGQQLDFTPDVGSLTNAERDAGVRVLKYRMLPSGQGPQADNDFVLLRYADVLLMRAEALNELGGQLGSAVALVNLVRERAYEPDQPLDAGTFTQASFRQQVLKERGNEFFWEGWRRQDLIRMGKYCDARQFKPADDDCGKRKLFPIPQRQLDANPNLTQNPGY